MERVQQERYDAATATWSRREIEVIFESHAFAKGGMRAAYHVRTKTPIDGVSVFCAKCSLHGDDEATYERDVMMQQLAALYAQQFNAAGPPKAVHFVEASLVTRLSAPPGEPTLFAFEPHIGGHYVKWTDNQSWRNVENNTPHAFSHFTYCKSDGKLLIVDLQGVAAETAFFFTDPQVRRVCCGGFAHVHLCAARDVAVPVRYTCDVGSLGLIIVLLLPVILL